MSTKCLHISHVSANSPRCVISCPPGQITVVGFLPPRTLLRGTVTAFEVTFGTTAVFFVDCVMLSLPIVSVPDEHAAAPESIAPPLSAGPLVALPRLISEAPDEHAAAPDA